MAKPAPGVWGIDVGQCALKALRLQMVEDKLTATAFDFVEYPKNLSQPDADPDQLIREALTQFLSRNALRGDTVAISVPGQSGLARFVKLPPVEEKKIAEIVKFEAKQQIPFNLDEVVWDFQKLGSGEVIDGLALETEIGLFAMKRDMIAKYLQHFKTVNVEVHCIQMAPLSLCNFLAYDMLGKEPGAASEDNGKKCVVGLDIGTDASNLVVTDGGRVIWQRPIPLGGNHFTRALTKDLKLTFAKAEHMKRNATKADPADLKKILASLKPVLSDFVGEVQRSLNFFTNTHRDAQVEYMVGMGNAFRLPGLNKYLAEKLQLDVRKVTKMQRLAGDEVVNAPIFNENVLSFGVAYGLALQGLARARLLTNLLPPEIRMERLVRAKKPWAVAAAGLLLVGLGASALGAALSGRTYGAPQVGAAIEKAKKVAGDASSANATFETKKKTALGEDEAVRAIVAGQFERENWLHLTKFLAAAVPQPDGANLPPEQRRLLWDDRPRTSARKGQALYSGAEAFGVYQARMKEGPKPPAPDEPVGDPLPPGIDDLIQFNVQSVDCRFSDDLKAFWTRASANKDEADVRPVEHFKKPPEGKGWVIEISGYTFHRNKAAFVRDTLMANIARMGIKAEVKPADGAEPPKDGTPAAPPAAAPAAEGATKVDDISSTKEPVVNRISHVLLYQYLPKETGDTSGFELIGNGAVDALVNGTAGGAMGGPGGMPGPGGPMGGMPGPEGAAGGGTEVAKPSRSGWMPLSSRAGTGGGGPGGMMGGPGGMMGRGGMPGGPASSGAIPGPGGPGGPAGPVGPNPGGHTRTEFIIVLIWQEPLPSDGLRCPEGEGTPGGGAPGGAAGGGLNNMPGPRGGMGGKVGMAGG
ncbi:MAG: type IV pilus assembly protein PilM [Gemmataceae bacterium]